MNSRVLFFIFHSLYRRGINHQGRFEEGHIYIALIEAVLNWHQERTRYGK